MTLQVEQEESIGILQDLTILPMANKVEINKFENKKMVARQYHITSNKYPTMDKIIIEYKVNEYTDRVVDYSVYLTNNSSDKVYLCKYSSSILNTLFDNIIMLELSNWRKVSQGKKPLRTIKDYQSLMFELNIDSNKRLNHLLYKSMEKNTSKLLSIFQKHINSNIVIPVDEWQKAI